MKQEIHPELHEVTISCGCGANFKTQSTLKSFHTEVCSQCHPFYTGKQKLVDTAGRIDRFRKRYGDRSKAAN